MGQKAMPAPDQCPLVLHVVLKAPAMTGSDYEGPAWKRFCCLDVHLDSNQGGTWSLPVEDGLVRDWKLPLSFQMDWQWSRMSLHLEVQRRDYYYMGVTPVVFRTEEPHTSGHTAMLGAAKVPLLDALTPGDDSDDDYEGEDEKKRRLDREKEWNLVKGTRVFQDRVKLQGWRPPAPEDVDGELVNVVCGTVSVSMCLAKAEAEDSD